MGCAKVVLHDDQGRDVGRAILCGGRAIKPCVGCGKLSTRACDFKIIRQGVSPRTGQPWRRHGTCSAPLCERCTTRLPGDKDACPGAHRDACLAACRRLGLEVPA